MIGDECRLCGAQRKINPGTGNLMWMRDGRVIAAPNDEDEARQRATEMWPEAYGEDK